MHAGCFLNRENWGVVLALATEVVVLLNQSFAYIVRLKRSKGVKGVHPRLETAQDQFLKSLNIVLV